MGALKKLVDGMQGKEVVPRGYPSPQTEVNTARDVGPHIPREQSANAKGDNVIDLPYELVKDTEEKKGMLTKLMESLKDPQQWAVLDAEWRRGLKDLQNAVLNPWNGITATHEEPGTIANPTPQQVTRELEGGEIDYER